MFIRKEYVNHFIMLFSTPPPLPLYFLGGNQYDSCRDKGLKSYIGPWPLAENVNWSEDE